MMKNLLKTVVFLTSSFVVFSAGAESEISNWDAEYCGVDPQSWLAEEAQKLDGI